MSFGLRGWDVNEMEMKWRNIEDPIKQKAFEEETGILKRAVCLTRRIHIASQYSFRRDEIV